MCIGLFITFLIGIWLPFRWMAVVVLGGGVLFVCLVSFIPHSPVWYIRQGFEAKQKKLCCIYTGRGLMLVRDGVDKDGKCN